MGAEDTRGAFCGEVERAMSEVLDAIRAICGDGVAREASLAEGLRQIRIALDGLGDLRPGAARDLGVVERNLGDCRALARDPLAERLVTALDGEPDAVAWDRSKSYDNEPSMVDFLQRYAVATIFGPDRFGRRCPYFSDRATLGVTLQAPNVDYPAHAHEAVEIYYILAGSADWRQGDGGWQRKAPGDFVLHRAHEPHAMRTGEEPLLAMFAWISDLMSDVYLVDSA
jgi:mannose-6-phosphate isomerase-like protein (cupin superfamily)